MRLQLALGLLGAGEGSADPIPRPPAGTARIGPPPGAVLQQVGAGAGGLWGCSHLGLAWGENSTLTPRTVPADWGGTCAQTLPPDGNLVPAGHGVAAWPGRSDAE